MHELGAGHPLHGLLQSNPAVNGRLTLDPHAVTPTTLPDPQTGQALRVAKVELSRAICPACERKGDGAFVTFVSDLRLVFACPNCRDLVWLSA